MRRNRNTGCLWTAARITATLSILFSVAPAHAIVVLKKGLEQPLLGHLVREDERTVVIREELPGGGQRETHIPRADIEELIVTVDPQRLAALDPAQPRAYREYAEELAEKHRDPEARDAARRLYAIAAVRSEGTLRKGALLGLMSLARSPAEERRFRAAIFLYDEQHDTGVLAQGPSPLAPGPTSTAETAPPGELLSAVRLIRQGRGAEAKALLELPHVRRAAPLLASIITLDELLSAAAARALTDEQLIRLLTAELSLSGEAQPSAKSGDVSPWSQTIKNGQLAPLPSLALESLTEFDPAECVFRGGKWVRP